MLIDYLSNTFCDIKDMLYMHKHNNDKSVCYAFKTLLLVLPAALHVSVKLSCVKNTLVKLCRLEAHAVNDS